MMLSIPIRGRLKSNRKTIVTMRDAIRWTTMARRERRSHVIRGRSHAYPKKKEKHRRKHPEHKRKEKD
jgi:hypothetical protein